MAWLEDRKDKKHAVKRRAFFCIPCLNALAERFMMEEGVDEYAALYRICAVTGQYYNHALARNVIEDIDRKYEDGSPIDPRVGFVDLYFRQVVETKAYNGKTFYNSEDMSLDLIAHGETDPDVIADNKRKILAESVEEDPNAVFDALMEHAPDVVLQRCKSTQEILNNNLSDTAKDNRSQVLQVFHYDPFINEDPADRESMYIDLATMIDDAMSEDLVRQKSALEIVRSFKHIDKLTDAIRELQATPESTIQHSKELKNLADQKSKETQLVTQFSKDHGFAEKYAMSKSKGSGTLSAVIRDMRDYHYDRGVVNKYNIETADAIKQVSDISAESIFKQLNLTESDYAQMVKEQGQELRKLKADYASLKEENRLLKEKHLKEDLMRELALELKDKGISDEDIEEVLKKEVRTK